MSRLFTARFPGSCGVCLESIEVGDDVRYGSFEDALVHDWCASDVDREDDE